MDTFCETFENLVKNGDLERLKFVAEDIKNRKLNNQVYNIDPNLIVVASEAGNLDILRFLFSINKNYRLCINIAAQRASKEGYLKIVKFLVENDFDFDIDLNEAKLIAINHNHVNIIKYLINKGAGYGNLRDIYQIGKVAKLYFNEGKYNIAMKIIASNNYTDDAQLNMIHKKLYEFVNLKHKYDNFYELC